MPRIQTTIHRGGKQVGEINSPIAMPSTNNRTGHDPKTLQIGRSPSSQILGTTARGVVTFDSLKKENIRAFQNEINLLEQKKQEVSPSIASIYKEGQQILKQIQEKTKQAKSMDNFYFFEDNRPIVKDYVRSKAELIGNFENRMKQLQSSMASAQRYIDRVSDDRRGASGEERIRLNTQRREEQAYLEGLRREMNIIKQYKDKNMRDMRFGEDIRYYPFDQVSKYANEVGDVYFRNQSARIWNRHRRAIANERAQQELDKLLKQHPGAKAAPDGSLYYVDHNLRQSIILLPPGSLKVK